MNLTPMQSLARDLEGNSILVSAAAGSGKTSVLSKRVIRKLTDPENHCDANRLMILTFTNAAAAEMRERISKQLRDMVVADPKNTLARRQLLLLSGAKICTIHSACLDLIRQNFHRLNIDPQFSIAEENRLALMRTEALDEFVDGIYDRTDDGVLQLLDYFARGRDDSALVSAVDYASNFLKNLPYPEQFIEKNRKTDPGTPFDILFGDALYSYLTQTLGSIIEGYTALAKNACDYHKLADFYIAESDDIACILKFVTARDFDGAFFAASEIKFKTHPRKPKDAENWQFFSERRKLLKERTNELIRDFLYADSKTILADREQELLVITTLLNLANEFNQTLFESRKQKRLMSFDDIEKYALELLVKNNGGSFEKTELAKELSEQLDEIIVDEYQDCNFTQNLIFTALSKDSKNIFAVGDVKQSIYRFRGAQPDIFLKKQNESISVTDSSNVDKPMRVDLSCNFRSDIKILDFVNKVFDTLMTKSRGGIDYKDSHRLTQLAPQNDDPNAKVAINVIFSDDVRSKLPSLQAEADSVAKKIKALVLSGECITDGGKPRPIRYDDIAILMRAPKSDGAIFEQALKANGVGCINNNPSENYLDTEEVTGVLAFLQVIDNPYNDIPLVTLMYSDFFGFSANELAKIRSNNRYSLFFDAVKAYAKTDVKTANFVKTVEYLRNLSMTTDVYGIISAVYEKSGILLRLSSVADGDSKKANLMMLLDYASKFESGRYRGLFAFINYIVKLIDRKDSIPAARLKKSDDCVSILSIHGSKGLEYPVVFLVGSAIPVNHIEREQTLLDSELGVGGYTRNKVRHVDFSSISRNLICEHQSKSELYEELRLLYVALTRAKKRLYITACAGVSSIERAVNGVRYCATEPSVIDFETSPSYFKWMLFSLKNTPFFKKLCDILSQPTPEVTEPDTFEYDISFYEADTAETENSIQVKPFDIDLQKARSLIMRSYAFENSTFIPAKLSVSEIKGIKSETKPQSFKKPRFMQKGVTGTDRGNATHEFLQFCDFSKITNTATFEKERLRLGGQEFITPHQSELVDSQGIIDFITSDIMQRLVALNTCKKEDRFIFTLPASEVTDINSNEPVVIQGIIDCWFEKEGTAVIVDYKTDRVTDESELISRYKVQLDMYEKALLKIHSIPTSAKYIYSFCLKKFIKL